MSAHPDAPTPRSLGEAAASIFIIATSDAIEHGTAHVGYSATGDLAVSLDSYPLFRAYLALYPYLLTERSPSEREWVAGFNATMMRLLPSQKPMIPDTGPPGGRA